MPPANWVAWLNFVLLVVTLVSAIVTLLKSIKVLSLKEQQLRQQLGLKS